MLNNLNTLRNQAGEEGFTLIELLVVIIIIGILSAIALPLFFNQQKEAIKSSMKSDVRNTVASVATALAASPGTSIETPGHSTPTNIGSSNVSTVVTRGNRVAILGDWKHYIVNGFSLSADSFTYHFNSSTGSYQTGAGSLS